MRNLKIALVSIVLAACGGGAEGGPEAAVRAWVETAEAAAENKDRQGLLTMVSESYADARGNDYGQIANMLRYYFFRQKSVGFVSTINEISLMGDTAALVDVTVVMGGTNADVPGIRADAYNFELELENSGDEWLLIGARWGKVGREMR